VGVGTEGDSGDGSAIFIVVRVSWVLAERGAKDSRFLQRSCGSAA
jgi:hypothetical protein